eukprot:scaffold20911_cov69-Phaeocystis_antarctica.AAC.4
MLEDLERNRSQAGDTSSGKPPVHQCPEDLELLARGEFAAALKQHSRRSKACARVLCHGDGHKHTHGHRERQEPEHRDDETTEEESGPSCDVSDDIVGDEGNDAPQHTAIASVEHQEWIKVQHTVYGLGGDAHRLECATATKRLDLEQARPLR